MIVGCYTLDLYCDNTDKNHVKNFPDTFTGASRQQCEGKATFDGWIIDNIAGTALCPECSVRKN
jgi:hypothetical protein